MNRKQFSILIVVLAVLGGAYLLLHKSDNNSWQGGSVGAGRKLFPKLALDNIAQISIKQDTNAVDLARKNDVWKVQQRNDYPANFTQISEFLLHAPDLKAAQTEAIGPSQLSRMQLAVNDKGSNAPTMVDLKDKDGKTLASLIVGKPHIKKPNAAQASQFGDDGYPDGRWVMLPNDKETALLISDPLANLEPNPASWVNKDFFKIEKPKSIAVDFPEAGKTNSWKLWRETETGDWKLADMKADEKLDASKVSGVTAPFSSPTFNDVIPGTDEAKRIPSTVVTVETFDHFTYHVTVGGKTNDDYRIEVAVSADLAKERAPGKDEKPEDKEKLDKAFKDAQKPLQDKLKQDQAFANWTYLAPAWNVDPILKSRKDLLETKEEAKPADKTETPADTGK